ncbi:MAG: hypothetical protein SGJ04_06315 [Bacteroidota bacterium]|nr:hypothetical protein [Bacteroidota bacterium]
MPKIKIQKIISRLKFGGKSDKLLEPDTISTESPKPANADNNNTLPEQNIEHKQGIEYILWIENDGILRDEGVIFGATSGQIINKLNTIDKFFAEKIAKHNQARYSIEQNIQNRENRLITLADELLEKKIPEQLYDNERLGKTKFAWSLSIMLIIVAFGVFAFFLTYTSIDEVSLQKAANKVSMLQSLNNQKFIDLTDDDKLSKFEDTVTIWKFMAIGIFVFGLFSSFFGKKLFEFFDKEIHRSRQQSYQGLTNRAVEVDIRPDSAFKRFLRGLRILSLPVITSLCIGLLCIKYIDSVQLIGMVIINTILFFLSGIIFFTQLSLLTKYAKSAKHYRADRKKYKRQMKKYKPRIAEVEEEINKIRVEIDALGNEHLEVPAELAILAMAEYKKSLFTSEYNLAQALEKIKYNK